MLVSVCAVFLATLRSQAQTITWLGVLNGGSVSVAHGVSADGSVVVGTALDAAGYNRAFRWTRGQGIQDLGTLGGGFSEARGVSANGRVVVGVAKNAAGYDRAFRWTHGQGMQNLGTLGGTWSEARGVSANGRVVVGLAKNAAGYNRAFLWAGGSIQDLGTFPGGNDSEAWGVSADGHVVVGTAHDHDPRSGQYRAFRWTQATGMQDLGTLGGGSGSVAFGVSANGSVVIGVFTNASGYHRAFRWTAAEGMQDLGTLSGDFQESRALGVSADGSVVVGFARLNIAEPSRAIRWTPLTTGWMIEDLNITYASLLTPGSVLHEARAISSDGRYIVGYGFNGDTRRYEAYLLDTCPGGDIDRDWICDDWERNGADVNGDRIIDLDLPALGARVGVRDIFVEYDAMTSIAPSQTAINAVVAAFRNNGFACHVQNGGDLNIPAATWSDPPSSDFYDAKRQYFGTPAERNSPNWKNIQKAKRQVFRYCVFAQQYDTSGSTGYAELPGDDLMVTLGHTNWQRLRFMLDSLDTLGIAPFRWDDIIAGTFMHELGHTLGLRHGGSDHRRYKPNYHSVMNYLWQTPKPAYSGSWVLDYSARTFNNLDENGLSEHTGIGGHAGHWVPIKSVDGLFVPESGPVDWNQDLDENDIAVAQDLNGDGMRSTLSSWDDWANLDLSHGPNWADGVNVIYHLVRPKDPKETPGILQEEEEEEPLKELTFEMYAMLNSSNTPPDTVRIIEPEDGAMVTPQPEFRLAANDAEGDTLKYHIVLTSQGTKEEREWWTGFVGAGEERRWSLPDSLALSEGKWAVRVRAMDWKTGLSLWSKIRHISVKVSGVEEDLKSRQPLLEGSVPNPSTIATTIRFSIPRREHVALKVFDVLGREVAILVDGVVNPGEHAVQFNTESITAGVYIVQMSAGGVVQRSTMVVIK